MNNENKSVETKLTEVKNDWSNIKSKIKARFGKLTDESIESVKGNLDTLTQKLQTAYGYGKDEAAKEYGSFKASLHAATEPKKVEVVQPDAPAATPQAASTKVA